MFKRKPPLAKAAAKPVASPLGRPNHEWHAVSIVSNKTVCREVLEFKGKRFLSVEAPPLPLANCSQMRECRCMYRHHNDRRAPAPRRRDEVTGLRRAATVAEERREAKDRRSTDF